MRLVAAILLALFLSSPPAFSQETGWEKYGVTERPTQAALNADQRYGGYPNNRYFNNDTKCSAVAELFSDERQKAMPAFLSYARMKLAETDLLARRGRPSLVDLIGIDQWTHMTDLYPQYCKHHPRTVLDQATLDIYTAINDKVAISSITAQLNTYGCVDEKDTSALPVITREQGAVAFVAALKIFVDNGSCIQILRGETFLADGYNANGHSRVHRKRSVKTYWVDTSDFEKETTSAP
jgi:hypothetical protein